MDGLLLDLRYAVRAIRRSPIFSFVAIGCLAVGIGVNVAAFSILHALLFSDLPGVHDQGRLTAVLVSYQTRWGRTGGSQLSTLEWDHFRGAIPGFTRSGVSGTSSVVIRLGGEPVSVRADFVSGDYFAMLGTRAVAGRLLDASDDRAGAPPAVVIGHQLWEREFGARPDAIGKLITIGDATFTVAGVVPRGYVGLYPGELVADPEFGAPYVILPLAAAPLVRAASRYSSPEEALDDEWLLFVGRRADGVSNGEVGVQANAVARRLAATWPRERASSQTLTRDPSTGSTVELLAGVAFVMAIPLLILLVACANLANQLLARAVQRGREIAIRLSLGATRRRVVRLLLVEAMVLAAAAVVLSFMIARALIHIVGTRVVVLPFEIPLDGRVVLFTLSIGVVTTLAFGLAPALRGTRLDLSQAIRDGGHAGGGAGSRSRSALVVVQVAASVALLAIAGVFLRAASRSHAQEAGANADRVVTAAVRPDLLGYDAARGRAFQREAAERLRALPGVEAVAIAPFGPVSSIPQRRIMIAGDPPDRERFLDVAAVSGDWFAIHAARPVAGRLFTAEETRDSAAVAVVNEAVVARLWPDGNAVGRSIRIGDDSVARLVTVVGVVPAAKRDPRDDGPHAIVTIPAGGAYSARASFYIRTRGSAAAQRANIRTVVHDVDRRLPAPAVATLGESVGEITGSVGQIGSGVAAMGAIALLLASLGLFAVLAFVVEQRRFEIGVRMALGAQARSVMWLVLRQSLTWTALGAAVGTVIAAATTVLLRSILFGLPPLDPLAFGGSTLVLLVVAIAASVAPVRLATRVDPMVALRAE